MTRLALTATVAAALAVAAPAAQAGLWSTAGGDPGRSGYQPRAAGSGPYELLWTGTRQSDRDVVTSPVVTGTGERGEPARVAYGTKDGRLHLRDLLTGEPVGDPNGVALGRHGDPRVLTGFGGSLTPATSSDEDRRGQLFVVLNDRPPKDATPEGEPLTDALAIAQVDEQTGALVQRLPIPGTEDLVASSAPLLGEPNAAGDRSLVFTATDDPQSGPDAKGQVLRVPIKAAQSVKATIDVAAVETSTVAALAPLAPPSLLVADDQTGARNTRPTAFATISSGAADAPLTSAQADALGTAGPSSQRLDANAKEATPFFAAGASVPVTPSGFAPGTGASGAGRAGAVLVATYDAKADRTTVHRLVLTPDGTGLVRAAQSAPVPGRPAPQLATTQDGQAPGDDAGAVVLTTSRALVALDGGDLSRRWAFAEDLAPGDTGFGRTHATVVNGTVFVARDNGQRLALQLADGAKLPSGAFDTTTAATATVASAGAPAAARNGVVVFASDKGVVAFRNRCGNRIGGTSGPDQLAGTLAGDDVQAGAADDTVDGGPGDDCLDGGAGADTLGGGFGADRLAGGPGADRLLGGAEADVLDGGSEDDRLTGGDGDDRLDGADGRDVLKGGDGADAVVGGAGDDRLYGAAKADTLGGGAGRDRLSGGAGNDRLSGGPGRDTLFGGGGDDVLRAKDGRQDVVRCGPGRDTATVDRGDRVSGCETVRR